MVDLSRRSLAVVFWILIEPVKHSIAERTMAKDTLALIQEIALE